MLWEQYCVMRISVIYRGRAVPLVWQVIEHASSSVAYETYRGLLDSGHLAAAQLRGRVSGQSGFCRYGAHGPATRLGWHWRIRIKTSFVVYRRGHRRLKLSNYALKPGQATSGSMCRSPMRTMAPCIWPWRTWPKMVNAG